MFLKCCEVTVRWSKAGKAVTLENKDQESVGTAEDNSLLYFILKPTTLSPPLFSSTAAPLPNALSQQRSLALFRAFCAMKYAIYALCVNSHKHSKCRDCVRSLLCDIPEDTASGEPAGD